jgi:O-antigen/teichoic acid export membrane protein
MLNSKVKNGNHLHMGAGIGFFALLTFFLLRGIEARLSLLEYGQFAAFWALLMGLVMGFTYPLESFGLALKSRNLNKVEIQNEEISAIQTAVIPVATLIILLAPIYVTLAFGGSWIYSALLLLCLTSFALIYSSRARLLNRNRFTWYAGLLGFEGLLRIAIAIILLTYISNSGISAGVSITIAAILTAWRAKRIVDLPSFSILLKKLPFNKAFVRIILANLATLTILNISPFLIQIFRNESGLSGKELNSLTIARIPIFLGPIIQSYLIPRIQFRTFEQGASNKHFLIKFMVASLFIYLLGILAFGIFGKSIVEVIYGQNSTALETNFFLIASTSALYLLFITVQSYFIAQNRINPIGKAAVFGIFTMFFVLLGPGEIILKTEIASAAAFTASLSYLGVTTLYRRKITSSR